MVVELPKFSGKFAYKPLDAEVYAQLEQSVQAIDSLTEPYSNNLALNADQYETLLSTFASTDLISPPVTIEPELDAQVSHLAEFIGESAIMNEPKIKEASGQQVAGMAYGISNGDWSPIDQGRSILLNIKADPALRNEIVVFLVEREIESEKSYYCMVHPLHTEGDIDLLNLNHSTAEFTVEIPSTYQEGDRISVCLPTAPLPVSLLKIKVLKELLINSIKATQIYPFGDESDDTSHYTVDWVEFVKARATELPAEIVDSVVNGKSLK